MMYQHALELLIREVSGVDTNDTAIRFILGDKLYTLTGDVTWIEADDEPYDALAFGIEETQS